MVRRWAENEVKRLPVSLPNSQLATSPTSVMSSGAAVGTTSVMLRSSTGVHQSDTNQPFT